ncbi:acetoacetate--CoA ligase [Mycobacterium sp. 21AC1]|uniref:acetoacetate--CoA ligase n=1 Tax=[Mycobacterium] appelbergii TaxID=2939269 RepID=UPI002938D850|nr:acetoacetate--CoA ligase [Mycobacterium sp. 21AC1]MDV3128993.1 acetoacetate--CoA ligase [Mycobacterium sp. 21AC1]
MSSASAGPAPIWVPESTQAECTQLARFTAEATARYGVDVPTYRDLWKWSTTRPEQFWACLWDFFGIEADGDHQTVLGSTDMPGAQWFPDTRLNYAEHALSTRHDAVVITLTEGGHRHDVSTAELRSQVGAFAAWLRSLGVQSGDRVVGYLPNGIHAVVGFLAAASIGAIWSQCGQDYGTDGAASRFAALKPTVLIAADGYEWNGRRIDRRAAAVALAESLTTLRATVWVPHLGLDLPGGPRSATWDEATMASADPRFERVPFGHPLWILFSSGTTGQPKGIVHGHGGVLLEHLKLLALHNDVGVGSVFFWYTSTNWMMWNLQVSGLLTGASIVTYDGSPAFPNAARLFEIAAGNRVDTLGVSPGYLALCDKADLHPGRDLDLSALVRIGATGAPLPAASYNWVRERVGSRVQVASTTGGTDVVSGFAGSAPTTPVWAGEISAPCLGVALDAYDDAGNQLTGQVGEMVITKPMPSMPLYFWNDPGYHKYRDAYFATYPGIWRHGDWVTLTDRGSVIVSGRSDATLNRQGVRLGSADIYAVVERMPEIADSLVIGVERGDGTYWMPLFVVMSDGRELDDRLRAHIRERIAVEASRRHVPDDILVVRALPHTRTGKRMEVPVKRIVQGLDPERAANLEAVDDPDALLQFTRFSPNPPRG